MGTLNSNNGVMISILNINLAALRSLNVSLYDYNKKRRRMISSIQQFYHKLSITV